VAFAVAMPEGEKRWSKVMKLAEALQKLDGKRGPTFGKQIEELEKTLKLALGKDVFARMSDLIVVVDPLVLTATGNPLKLIILTATDEAAAKAFEDDVLPKVAALLPPGGVKPTEQTIQGQRIQSLPFDMLGPGSRLYCGRQGKTLAFGMTGDATAGALALGAKKSGLLAEAKTATVLKEVGDASIVGVLPLHTLLPMIVPEETGGRFRAAIPVAPGGAPAPPAKPAGVSPFKLKLSKDLAQASEPMPPAILMLERKPEQVTLVIRQTNFKAASAKIIDTIVNASLDKLLNPGGGGGVGVPEVKPPAKN
jgi:hypothetical protein